MPGPTTSPTGAAAALAEVSDVKAEASLSQPTPVRPAAPDSEEVRDACGERQ